MLTVFYFAMKTVLSYLLNLWFMLSNFKLTIVAEFVKRNSDKFNNTFPRRFVKHFLTKANCLLFFFDVHEL